MQPPFTPLFVFIGDDSCFEMYLNFYFMTDRYKYLPSPEHRLKFLDMQLELLEDFRIRLVQVMKEVTHDSLGDTFCAILNGVHYITDVLREWCNTTVSDSTVVTKSKACLLMMKNFTHGIKFLHLIFFFQFFVELQYHNATRPVEPSTGADEEDTKVKTNQPHSQ